MLSLKKKNYNANVFQVPLPLPSRKIIRVNALFSIKFLYSNWNILHIAKRLLNIEELSELDK